MNVIENAEDFSPSSGEFPSDRRKAIRADLERRLRKICAHFPEEDFQALLDTMTERKLRSERGKIN
jgi:hypothetical protein